MNKLARRVLAFMLMACLLVALVPAVASAEAATPYVIDFRIDTQENLTWDVYSEATDTTTTYRFAGTNFAHAQKNSGHAAWLEAFNAYYADGTINFSFPHTVITSADAEADETLEGSIGKVKNDGTYKSHYLNGNQFGSYKYNAPATTIDWTGLKIGAASATYNNTLVVGNDKLGWNAMILRAPDAGIYDVTMEYTKYGAAGNKAKVYLMPYTAEMKVQVANDPAAFNAAINAMVLESTAADEYVGGFSSWIAAGSTPVTGQIANLGQQTVGMFDEYLMVISQVAGKYDYIQNVTFTPVAEQEIAAETTERNYSISGTVNTTVVLNKNGVTESVEALYDAGTIDWSFLGTNSADDEVQLQKGYIYNQTFLKNVTGTENDLHAYEAYKLRSPGAGKHDISFTANVPAAGKTQVWTDVYVAEYTEGMDPLSVIAEENFIGLHAPKSSDNPTTGASTTYVGEYEFADDKEYIIVLKADAVKYGWATTTVDTENDRHYTANTYMINFVIEPQEAPITFVPKAYIGTTPYATVTAAAAAAKAGDTIKLAVDFLGNIDLPAGVSLDLAGNDWTVTNLTTTNGSETVIDSVGGGNLIAKSIDLFGGNSNVLPLATAENTYTLADYTMTVDADDYEDVGEATRFWFKLDLADEYLDLIAGGESGLTIGVELSWGGAEDLAVTFEGDNGAEAFAAEWAATYKAGNNVWLYVDITGIDALASDLTVTPVLQVNDTTLNVGSLVYEIA